MRPAAKLLRVGLETAGPGGSAAGKPAPDAAGPRALEAAAAFRAALLGVCCRLCNCLCDIGMDSPIRKLFVCMVLDCPAQCYSSMAFRGPQSAMAMVTSAVPCPDMVSSPRHWSVHQVMPQAESNDNGWCEALASLLGRRGPGDSTTAAHAAAVAAALTLEPAARHALPYAATAPRLALALLSAAAVHHKVLPSLPFILEQAGICIIKEWLHPPCTRCCSCLMQTASACQPPGVATLCRMCHQTLLHTLPCRALPGMRAPRCTRCCTTAASRTSSLSAPARRGSSSNSAPRWATLSAPACRRTAC